MSDGDWIRIGPIKAHLDAKTVNSIITTALRKRAISITQKPDLRQEIGEEFLKVVTPFVPMSVGKETSGQLRASGRATSDGRVYWSATNDKGYNYASAVYDPDEPYRWPDGKYKKPSTDGTYPRWVEKVHPETEEWTAFVNTITPIIKRRFAQDE
jgi:hypothetical protein